MKAVVLLMSLLLITSCTPRSTVNVLNIPIPIAMDRVVIDPQKMEDAYSMMIVLQLFRGLFRYMPDGRVEPDLVASWIESEDKKTYVFELKSLNLSGSQPLLSKHVVNTFARLFYLGAGMASDLSYIQGAAKFVRSHSLKDLGIKAIGNNKIQFKLASANPLFFKHLATVDCAILPIDNYSSELPTDLKSTGPYYVFSRNENEIILKLRTLDFSRAPKVIRFSELSRNDAFEAARAGKVDTIDLYQVSNEQEKILVNEMNWKKTLSNRTGEFFVIMNPKKMSFELRDHLFSLIDPKLIAESLMPLPVNPAYGVIPPELAGHLTKSKQPLAKVYRGPAAELDLEYIDSSTVSKIIADFVKRSWEKSSDKITVNLRPLSVDILLKRMFAKESMLVVGNKLLDYPDGISNLNYFRSNNKSNFFHAHSKKIDSLLEKVDAEFDSATRSVLYQEVQEEILKERTFIPIIFGSNLSGLWSDSLKKVPAHPLGLHLMPFELLEIGND
jgi:ABC-type oligopeptide transport system substrate-binding subunit